MTGRGKHPVPARHRDRHRVGRSGTCLAATTAVDTSQRTSGLSLLPRPVAMRCRNCPYLDQERRRCAAPLARPDTRTRPGLASFLYGLEAPFGARAFGGPAGLQAWAQGSPAALDSGVSRRRWPGLAGSLAAGGGGPARCLSVGTHGAGRRRSAVPRHPPPAGPRRHIPPADPRPSPSGRAPSSPRRAILSPRKLPVKGATACGLRVPPLRSAQTLDSDLPRQEPAPAGDGTRSRCLMCERERRPNLCVIDGEPAKEPVLVSEGASGAVSTDHCMCRLPASP